MLDMIGGFLSSAATGGLFGIFGTLVQGWLKNKQRAQELQHEIELGKLRQDELRLEHELRTAELDRELQIVEAKGRADLAVTEERAAADLMAASMRNDKARWVSGWQEAMPTWMAAIIGFLMGLVDFLRGLIRPVATIAFSIMLWLIYRDLDRIVSGFDSMPLSDAMAVWLSVVNAVILLSVTCISWWFGARLINKVST